MRSQVKISKAIYIINVIQAVVGRTSRGFFAEVAWALGMMSVRLPVPRRKREVSRRPGPEAPGTPSTEPSARVVTG